MTVAELIDSIIAAYPGASGEAMRTFKPVFVARFGKREGGHLAAAFEATLAEFRPTTRQPFPIPGDFEKHMPSANLDLGKGKTSEWGPPIDIPGRNRRAESLFANWQAGQCRRADKGNPLLRRALENTARQVADVLAWNENPEPMILTSTQLKTACQSALSLERRLRFGQPPKDKYIWWQQIAAIAEEWSIRDAGQPISPEWWDKPTGDAFKPGADDEPAAAPAVTATTVTRSTPAAPRDPAAHHALLKARLAFFRRMGTLPEYVAIMERELAEIEARAEAQHEATRP